jgi:hypothetical protein
MATELIVKNKITVKKFIINSPVKKTIFPSLKKLEEKIPILQKLNIKLIQKKVKIKTINGWFNFKTGKSIELKLSNKKSSE